MVLVSLVQFSCHLNWRTLRNTIARAFQRRLMGLSAEIAYNAMLALFPAILAVLTAIGLFEQSVKSSFGTLAVQLEDIVPEQVWVLLFNFVQQIRVTNSSWFSLSFIAAIWVFSGAVSATMNALDQIHQVPLEQKRAFWQAKLISIILTVGTIILLISASFLVLLGDFVVQLAIQQNWGEVLSIAWQVLNWILVIGILLGSLGLIEQIYHARSRNNSQLRKFISIMIVCITTATSLKVVDIFFLWMQALINALEIDQQVESLILDLWHILSWSVALGIVATAFASIYRFGPSRWLPETPIIPGAVVAAISWAGVSALFRLYVSNFGNYNKVYGAVGAVVVLMLWLYLSALVMLLGDQLNATVGEVIKTEKVNLPVENNQESDRIKSI